MHPLLQRQIKRFIGEFETLPADYAALFDAVGESYEGADRDRAMIERSLDIASREMLEQNQALARELNARRAAESQLERVANYDEITGLATRSLACDRLKQAIAGAERHGQEIAVLVLGLDHFKAVTDIFGHDIGNELLKIVGDRLVSCVRGSDTVGRLSRDEFIIILPDLHGAPAEGNKQPVTVAARADPHLSEMLRRILSVVSETIILAERELHVTCSIGLSVYPLDGDSIETLIKNADAAMGSAKQAGRNNFKFYTSELSVRIEERLAMQGQLRLALEREEFVLHYQPQVDLCDGRIVGMEALVRWNHPERGQVQPAEFIGLAEESGLIVPIGAWVIRTACAQAKAWQDAGCGKFRMAVNLSVRQFAQADLVEYIAAVLQETGLDAHSLEIELTESSVMTDVERSIDILHRFKALGLHMSIDDFGTGYSSLSYLKRFPIDVLKVDQSFVRDIETADDAAIVKAIVSMAHSLGMRVIAEGVETESQCDFLRLNMCDEIQGYLFSKPTDAAHMGEMLQQDMRLPSRLLRFEKPPRTLLLVDDESNILNALKRLLRGGRFKILTAGSGQAGLDIMAQQAVDVIVSDQRMPGMTGVEFLGIAKNLYPDTVRIVLSGYTELHSVTDAVNQGAIYKFLTKPWDDEQLKGHIEEAFRRKEMADENRRLNLEVSTANQELAAANRKLEELVKMKQQQIARDEISLDIVREALRQIPLAVIGVDDDDMAVFANDAAQSLFDKTASILGSDIKQLIPDLNHATDSSGNQPCMVEVGGSFYEVISRRMGHASRSRGKLMTLSPVGVKT
ncbi:MAG: EAL domain-containing protein [Burkholderiaceae bacterium]|nr:EAL domain-containing protein [Burkholderiaceae bacterium]